jgi:hypothetical protein
MFVPDRGDVTKMIVVSQVNHFLDAMYASCVGAVDCGVNTTPPVEKPPKKKRNLAASPQVGGMAMPDGRNFDY